MTSISLALSQPIIIDLSRAVFANLPSSVVVIDIGNYHPGLRDGRIDAIDCGMKAFRAWWTDDTRGESKVDGVIHFRFGDRGFFDMKVLELDPTKRVLWQVVDGPEEWIGTKVSFDLKQDGDFTIVFFKHQGWKEPVEFMHHCSIKWAVFLMSLKSLLETGKGAPIQKTLRSTTGTKAAPSNRGSDRPGCSTGIDRLPATRISTHRRLAMQHQVVSREEWLKARVVLLEKEKELTRHSDEVARQRQALPWVRVDKEYRFETDEGSTSLADLFRGRSQLIVYHFMFGPDWKAGCPTCSMIADAFNGSAVHLANHDVMLWAVSRAPLSKLQAYKRRMGWTFSWASSQGGDFNFDFNVSITEEQQREGAEYNYRREPPTSDVFRWRADQEGGGDSAEAKLAAMSGTDVPGYHRDRPGMSAFAFEDGVVCHTYSTYARGADPFFGVYHWLDRAPKGRNETGVWWRRHDEYDKR